MNYLLDTSACIALINGKPASPRGRFQKMIEAGAKVFVSPIAVYELWYGVSTSSNPQASTERLAAFFAGPIQVLPFDTEDAQLCGAVRADLEDAAKPIGAYDLLTAGQALRHKLTLVTANTSEFARVKGLVWQDWAKP